MLGVPCGTRSNGILLYLRANSRNDSTAPHGKGQPGGAGLGPSLTCVVGPFCTLAAMAMTDNGHEAGDDHGCCRYIGSIYYHFILAPF